MGSSRWRLQTALNYVAQRVRELGREEDVEILVADWGSENPLREVLELNPTAASLVSFLEVPTAIAELAQQDSPFSEVHALNAAARRTRGEYIGRIDQDTLVGKHFLELFFELYEGKRQLDVPLNQALLFSNQKMVPYRFAVRCPSLSLIERFIFHFGRRLPIELTDQRPFYAHGVGIWLVHRDVWNRCGGYDERMIYMNSMEVNMISRLLPHYKMINLGELTGYDFFHLEHYHPWQARKSSAHRKVNKHLRFLQPDAFHPNSGQWGLIEYPLETNTATGPLTVAARESRFELLLFMLMMMRVGFQIFMDTAGMASGIVYTTWKHRMKVVWNRVYGEPILTWPHLVRKLWMEKSSLRSGTIRRKKYS